MNTTTLKFDCFDNRKQKRGGDVLAWMTKKAKISVKFQDEGKEKILDKAIYIMKLIGLDSDGSSDNDKKVHRKRYRCLN